MNLSHERPDSTAPRGSLDEIDKSLAYLSEGPESVQSANEAMLRVARAIFEANDFAVAVPTGGADGGIDLVANHRAGESVGVVAKCTVHRLGSAQIREVIALADEGRHSQYLLLTNSALRPDAIEFSRQAAGFSVSIATLDTIRVQIPICITRPRVIAEVSRRAFVRGRASRQA